tara:strand:- start:1882 stop:3210 length:1329 start_codon:yes stop_codon:yes gene_type:complete
MTVSRAELLRSFRFKLPAKEGIFTVSMNLNNRVLTSFLSSVNTTSLTGRYRYNNGNNANTHSIRTGYDQSINYYARNVVTLLNNCLKRASVFAFFDENCKIMIQKHEKKYYINGNQITKSLLNGILPSVLMRMPLLKNQEEMEKQINIAINTDPVIAAAIVNKVEYNFFITEHDSKTNLKTLRPVSTLLNIEKTSKDTTAIELYEGVWIGLKDNQIKSFINSCKGNKNKFLGISPQELYYMSRGEVLSDSQLKVVHAFLEQNRKSSLVEKRSMELFEGLTERFKGKIYSILTNFSTTETEEKKTMAVRGKILDWIVVDSGGGGGRQDVSTFAVIDLSNYVKEEKYFVNRFPEESKLSNVNINISSTYTGDKGEEYYLMGPICIDQQHTGISLGDQFAARAMALLNDIHSCRQVSTLRGYEKFQPKIRVDWDALSVLSRKRIS